MALCEAMKEQYYAGLAMLKECVEKCPKSLWHHGEQPRTFWRIVWHAAFFSHLYLLQSEADFDASIAVWPAHIWKTLGIEDAHATTPLQVYELNDANLPLTPSDLVAYIEYVASLVGPTLDRLDLDATETGFSWYPNMSKLSHELMNLRHLQGHVGQLSELLMAQGIDTQWMAKNSVKLEL